MPDTKPIKAGRAFVELFADNSKLQKGLAQAEARLKAWGKSIQAAGIKMLAAGGAVVTPILAAAKIYASTGSQLAEMAARTGMSVEALSVLKYAAGQCGVEVESLQTGIIRMDRMLTEAAKGSDKARDTLFQLGLSMAGLRRLSPEDQFTLIADRLSKVENPTKRAALAMEIFGRGGAELLPMLEGGAAGLARFRDEAKKYGLVMSTDSAQGALALERTLKTLEGAYHAVVNAIGSAVAPTLEEFGKIIVEKAKFVADFIKKNKDLVVTILKVGAGVMAAGAALIVVGGVIRGLAMGVRLLHGAFSLLHTALSVGLSILSFLLSPLGMVIAGVVCLGVALLQYTGAGGRALQWLGEVFNGLAADVSESMGAIGTALAAGDIGKAAAVFWSLLKMEWVKGVNWLTGIWVGFKLAVAEIWDDLWYNLLYVGTEVWSGIQGAWEDLCTVFRVLWEATVGGIKIAWARVGAWLAEGWSLLESGWEHTCHFFKSVWYEVVAGAQKVWAYFIVGLEKAWNLLKKIAHPIDFNLEEANQQVDAELQKKLQEIDARKNEKENTSDAGTDENLKKLQDQRKQAEQEYQDYKKKIATETSDAIARRVQENEQKHQQIDKEHDESLRKQFEQENADKAKRKDQYDKQVKDAQDDVDKAKKEWQDAIDAAKKAPAGAAKPGEKPSIKPGTGAALDWAEARVSVAGTFNPNALWGFAGSPLLNRIAAATEATAKNTAKTGTGPTFSGGIKMAITVTEKIDSRKRSEGNITATYLVSGTSDQAAALSALMADAPTTLEGMRRYWFPAVEPIRVDEVNDDGLWQGEVTYMHWPLLDINVQTITASTSGGTQHIKCSRNTAGRYSASGDAPDMGGCIGATKDGVEGVDIIVPVFNFKVRKALPGKPNFSTLYNLTGKINSGSFTVHDNWNGESISVSAGECLFRGAEVPEPRKEDGACEVTYDFSASPNMSSLQVGTIGSISKNGWQYLWVFFVNQIIGSGDTQILAPQPKFVYVEDVYQSGDFSVLGLT